MSATITPFPTPAARPSQVGFERPELQRILDLYGRMVAAGEWRDYAMDFDREAACFSAFRRAVTGVIAEAAGRSAWIGLPGAVCAEEWLLEPFSE